MQALRSEEGPAARGPKLAGAAAVVLATGVLVACAAMNRGLGTNADESIYLLLADWFAARFGHDAPEAAFVWRFNQFPPLYPLLLGALNATSGHVLAARLVTAVLAGAAALACAHWLQRRGVGPLARAAVALAWLVLPYTLFIAVDARSETLYALMSMLALGAMSSRRDTAGLGAATAAVIAAALTRSVGIAFLPAFAWWAWRSRAPRRVLWIALATGAVGGWMLFRALWLQPEADYLADAYARYHGRPIAVVMTTLAGSGAALWRGWCGLFDVMNLPWRGVPAALVLALAAPGGARALRAGDPAAWYLAGYLAVILAWPYPDHAARFLWPVAPVVFAFALQALAAPRVPRAAALAATGVVGLVCLAVIVPGWQHFILRYVEPLPPELERYRGSAVWLAPLPSAEAETNLRLLAYVNESLRASAGLVPAGGCLFSVHPERAMLLARRPSRPPPLPATDATAFEARIAGCDFVHVVFTTGHPTFPPGYPLARLPHAQVLAQFQLPMSGRQQPLAVLLRLR